MTDSTGCVPIPQAMYHLRGIAIAGSRTITTNIIDIVITIEMTTLRPTPTIDTVTDVVSAPVVPIAIIPTAVSSLVALRPKQT